MGLKFSKLKTNLKGKILYNYPTFYKYTVYKGKPLVQMSTAVERMLIPFNKKYNNNTEILAFLRCILPSLGTPATSLLPFYLYYAFVNNLVRKENDRQYTVRDVILLHVNIFDKLIKHPQMMKAYYKWKSKGFINSKDESLVKSANSILRNKIMSLREEKFIKEIFRS